MFEVSQTLVQPRHILGFLFISDIFAGDLFQFSTRFVCQHLTLQWKLNCSAKYPHKKFQGRLIDPQLISEAFSAQKNLFRA